jgi:glucose uptake protein GlcU
LPNDTAPDKEKHKKRKDIKNFLNTFSILIISGFYYKGFTILFAKAFE